MTHYQKFGALVLRLIGLILIGIGIWSLSSLVLAYFFSNVMYALLETNILFFHLPLCVIGFLLFIFAKRLGKLACWGIDD